MTSSTGLNFGKRKTAHNLVYPHGSNRNYITKVTTFNLVLFQRPGAFAIYLEPWHADIHDFLDCRKNTGKEENRARDLFYALWIPDLFMKRVEADKDWTLMCPHECPGLEDVWGDEFDELYEK